MRTQLMAIETIGNVLDRGSSRPPAGRAGDLEALTRVLAPGGALVVHLNGRRGIGKTALVRSLGSHLRGDGWMVIELDAGIIPPRADAVLDSLAAQAGATASGVEAIAAVLAERAPAILLIDNLDKWRFLSGWLRTDLIPHLPASCRILLVEPMPPAPGWGADFGSHFGEYTLKPLSRAGLRELLGPGVPQAEEERVWKASRGHPMLARMAMRAGRLGGDDDVLAMADAILAVGVPGLEALVEAASVVRRGSRGLFEAMTGRGIAALEPEFSALPFVGQDSEGYYLVEPLGRALSERLSATDPERHDALREAAVNWISSRLDESGAGARWRYMADLLYLVPHPQVRNNFFPPDAPMLLVEPARPPDMANIIAMAGEADGPEGAAHLRAWAEQLPHRFSVARGSDGSLAGFYVAGRPDDPVGDLVSADPLLRAWLDDLARRPAGDEALFMRRMILEKGPGREAARAACHLDLKRHYLERPGLRRVYAAFDEEDATEPMFRRIGFVLRPDLSSGSLVTALLALPGGLVGWYAGLAGVRPARAGEPSSLPFDRALREVRIEGEPVRLTRKEADVLAMLIDGAPGVIDREALIEQVWERTFVGSNVVDAVIRTLRKKLGPLRGRIETIPGAGYRYVPEDDAE